MKKASLLLLGLGFLTLTSCGGGSKPATDSDSATEEPAPAPAPAQEENQFTVEGNDQMQYNITELKATAGKPITITLKNAGKLPKETMGHNLIVLKPGTNIDDFAKEAINAKDTDYIPKSKEASIIAHTKLLGSGESDTITFTINEKGTYDYICSFPGHYSLMHGKLIVE